MRKLKELPNLGRPPLLHGTEHLRKMLETSKLSGKSGSLDAMYRFMGTIGIHRWCLTPIELCRLPQLLACERFWITHVHRPLNNKLPTKGTNKWRKLGRFHLYPHTTFASDARSAAINELTDRRSTLSLRAQITLLHASQDCIEGQIWDKLFRKVSGRVYRETKIRLKNLRLSRCQTTVHTPNNTYTHACGGPLVSPQACLWPDSFTAVAQRSCPHGPPRSASSSLQIR